jgi:hypothetical protein
MSKDHLSGILKLAIFEDCRAIIESHLELYEILENYAKTKQKKEKASKAPKLQTQRE